MDKMTIPEWEVQETNEYYNRILNAIAKLGEEKFFLLFNMKIHEIISLMKSEDEYDKYMTDLDIIIHNYRMLGQSLEKLKLIMENHGESIDFSKSYDELSEEDKLPVTFEMLNNPEFQKNLKRVLTLNYNWIGELGIIPGETDKLHNVLNSFEDIVSHGIGLNYKRDCQN